MPPTTNKQFILGRIGKHRRLIKSHEARSFDGLCNFYGIVHAEKAALASINLLQCIQLGYTIEATTEFVFPFEKIFAKNGLPKTIDANNRIKSCLDGVSKLIEIDDKYFFSGSYRKVGCKTLKDAYVNVILKPVLMKEFQIEDQDGSLK